MYQGQRLSSEMLLHLFEPLVVSSVLLAHPVAIEFSVQATELVGRTLTVVVLQVCDDLGGHVSVLRSSTDRWNENWSCLLHERSCVAPDREDDKTEVSHPEGETLLAALHPHGVQVHMELRGDVRVQDGVDVLEMIASRVLVKSIGLGVGSVP